MNLTKTLLFVTVAFSSMTSLAIEQSQLSMESQQLVSDLKIQIKSTLLAIIKNEDSHGNSIEHLAFDIDLPAKTESDLGLVLTPNNDGQLNVISVTSGGAGERIGLKPGDIITAIDHQSVADMLFSDSIEMLTNLSAAQSVHFTIVRNGKSLEKQGVVSQYKIPAMKIAFISNEENIVSSGCGFIAVDITPSKVSRVYPVNFNKLDDEPVSRNKRQLKLATGNYRIRVNELITDPDLTRRAGGVNRSKEIEVQVEANKTIYLGAQFNLNTKSSRDRYWSPILVKTVDTPCKQ